MAAVVQAYFPDVTRGSVPAATAELLNALASYSLNRALTSGGLAIAGTTSKVQNASSIAFTVDGAFYSKSATDNLWTLSGTAVAAGSWQKYALLLNSSGTASIQEATQSTVSAAAVNWSNVSAVGPWAPLLTLLQAGTTVVGVITVATDATHTFTPGTTALSATGITTTYTNGLDGSLLPLIGSQSGTLFGLGA